MIAYVENSARPETWARDTGKKLVLANWQLVIEKIRF